MPSTGSSINTITPSAVLELGGAELLSWVTAFYLVFSIVGSSGAAFLKARLGLRTVLIGSSLIAVVGSLIIAAAPNMEVLLAGRIVQGFAEGIVMALCYVIAADAVGEDALPSLFGLLAVVWATATIGGPILGGVLAHIWSMAHRGGRAGAARHPVPGAGADRAAGARPSGPTTASGWPLLRLIFLTGGSLAVCVASESKTPMLAIRDRARGAWRRCGSGCGWIAARARRCFRRACCRRGRPARSACGSSG